MLSKISNKRNPQIKTSEEVFSNLSKVMLPCRQPRKRIPGCQHGLRFAVLRAASAGAEEEPERLVPAVDVRLAVVARLDEAPGVLRVEARRRHRRRHHGLELAVVEPLAAAARADVDGLTAVLNLLHRLSVAGTEELAVVHVGHVVHLP